MDYDIPYIRSSQQRVVKTISELERKAKEARRNGNDNGRQYKKMCHDMGIQDNGINSNAAREGLTRKILRELPQLLKELVQSIRSEEIREAVEVYSKHVADVHPDVIQSGTDAMLVAYAELCSIVEVGDSISATSVGGAQGNGQEAKGDNVNVIEAGSHPETQMLDEIDWDICVDEKNAEDSEGLEAEIDWDVGEIQLDDTEVVDTTIDNDIVTVDEIDWNIDVVEDVADEGHDEIDWDITEDIKNLNAETSQSESCNEDATNFSSPFVDGATTTMTAVQYMAESSRRNKVIDDIVELKCFLLQRLEEEESQSHSQAISSQAGAILGSKKLRRLLEAVDEPLSILQPPSGSGSSGSELRQLLLMHSSGRYLARSAAAIDQLKEQVYYSLHFALSSY